MTPRAELAAAGILPCRLEEELCLLSFKLSVWSIIEVFGPG